MVKIPQMVKTPLALKLHHITQHIVPLGGSSLQISDQTHDRKSQINNQNHASMIKITHQ